MSTSTARARGPRTVEGTTSAPPPLPRRPRSSGVLAAVQGAALSLAVVVLPAVVAFLASPGQSQDVGWGSSVGIGAALWLLGHGVPLGAGGVTVTFVPLGLTALALFCCFATARRTADTSLAAWVAGTVAYGAVTTGVALLVGSTPVWGPAAAAVGGLVVGGVGLGAGILARPDAPRIAALAARTDRWCPPALRVGLRAALVGVSLLVVVSALLTAVWAIAGRATSGDVVDALAPGTIGGIVLGLAQLAVLPDLVAWAGAWLVGPGFVVGQGSSFTALGTDSGALPAIPILGALPGDDWTNALTPWAPALVVALGVVAGTFAWRRLRLLLGWSGSGTADGTTDDDAASVPWTALALCVAGVVLGVVALVGLAAWAASGAVGPGRLGEVGPPVLRTALLAAAEVGGGAALALLVGRLGLAGRLRH